jgi:arylsulfatase
MDGKKETERRDLQLLLLLIALACIFCAPPTDAQQFDAPFTKAQKQNAAAWEQEDRAINARLAELKKKHGKSPNIIYILADDIGWGELGSYGGGRNRGTPTPNLDALAADGMKFMSHYSEPSCTPTRLALMTGRHPVRTGVDIVLWPGQTQGLEPGEITVAEMLSKAGYHTAMFGKWHVGDLDRHAPERQGFDYAYYGLYNGAIYSWFNQDRFYSSDTVDGAGYFYDFPGTFEDYEKKYGIKIRGHFEGFKGKDRKEIEPITATSMEDMERNSIRRIKDYIKEKSDSDKPFLVYWASYAQQMAASPKEYRNIEDHDRANNQSAQLAQLDELDIEENTLVVWVSDNGPMYAFWPNSGYSWLRGGKGDVYEGGVRTPGIARWPGIIEPGQTVHDIISVTDLFTTAARIAGVVDDLPDDRVIDGVDQTALLVNGEGHGRRNYLFHYSGNRLAAVRMEDFKLHILSGSRGGLPNMELYNVMRDPGEKFGEMFSQLWAVVPFQRLIGSHMGMIKEYPHRELPSGTF